MAGRVAVLGREEKEETGQIPLCGLMEWDMTGRCQRGNARQKL